MQSNENHETNNRTLSLKRFTLMVVLFYFSISNFAAWVVDSFIEARSSPHSWQNDYYNWAIIINNIFNPISLFFRFNSVLLFLEVLFDKQRQPWSFFSLENLRMQQIYDALVSLTIFIGLGEREAIGKHSWQLGITLGHASYRTDEHGELE